MKFETAGKKHVDTASIFDPAQGTNGIRFVLNLAIPRLGCAKVGRCP